VAGSAEQPVFYYDLGSPECYLVAEQVMHILEVVPEWQPVLAADLAGPSDPDRAPPPINRSALERKAGELELQPVRWPESAVADSRPAMLAATYAKQIGRGVAFSLAAFRQAFAAGRDLGDPDTVLIAGAACEMHPTALSKALTQRSVARALAGAAVRAREAGVRSVPAIEAGGVVFEGPEALPRAAETLRRGVQALAP
jgi:2-hydroxychromene-2-carboxylate isomerase